MALKFLTRPTPPDDERLASLLGSSSEDEGVALRWAVDANKKREGYILAALNASFAVRNLDSSFVEKDVALTAMMEARAKLQELQFLPQDSWAEREASARLQSNGPDAFVGGVRSAINAVLADMCHRYVRPDQPPLPHEMEDGMLFLRNVATAQAPSWEGERDVNLFPVALQPTTLPKLFETACPRLDFARRNDLIGKRDDNPALLRQIRWAVSRYTTEQTDAAMAAATAESEKPFMAELVAAKRVADMISVEANNFAAAIRGRNDDDMNNALLAIADLVAEGK